MRPRESRLSTAARRRSRSAPCWRGLGTALVLIGGCCPSTRTVDPPPNAYFGPTDPMEKVVADVDHNAAAVPTLWAQLTYAARLVEKGKADPTVLSGDGGLLFRQPSSLRLAFNKDVAGAVFEAGSNGTEFWVKLRSGANDWNYYWGHTANVGRPGCDPVPVQPDLVVEVLGVGMAGVDFLRQPVPVMRFDNLTDSYVFDFNVRGPDRWLTLKEVAYDRRTKRPTRVALYDAAGRAVVSAALSRHAPVAIDGVPKEQWPTVARHFELLFPDTGSTIGFDLDDPALTHGTGRGLRPNAASFTRPEPDENNHVIQVDKNCPDAAG